MSISTTDRPHSFACSLHVSNTLARANKAVSKFDDHLPLHRLEQRFTREGVHLSRSTMGDWVEQSAELLRPIADAMAQAALSAHRIHTDDTGIPILAPGKTHKGHVWVYIPDDDSVIFRYTERRKGDGPREFLRWSTRSSIDPRTRRGWEMGRARRSSVG